MDRHHQFHNSPSSRYVPLHPPPPLFSDESRHYHLPPPPPHPHHDRHHSHHHNHLPRPPPLPTPRLSPGSLPPPPPLLPQQEDALRYHHSSNPRVIQPQSPFHLHHHHPHNLHPPPQPIPPPQQDFLDRRHQHHHQHQRLRADDGPIPPHRLRLHHYHDHHPIDLPQSPRISDRVLFNEDDRHFRPTRLHEHDDESRHFHRRREPLSRTPVEPTIPRPETPFGSDRGIHHRAHDFERVSSAPSLAVDGVRRDGEAIPSPRFRDYSRTDIRLRVEEMSPELREDRQFLVNTRESFDRRHLVSDDGSLERDRFHRRHVVADGDKPERDILDGANHQNPSRIQRDLAPKSVNNGRFHGLMSQEELFKRGRVELEEENSRRGNTLEELPGPPISFQNRIIGGRDEFLDVHGKGKNRPVEGGRYTDRDRREEAAGKNRSLEVGRYSDPDRRNETPESVRSPRKRLPPKKSAFLRMQPARSSSRNRDEHVQSPGKGKEPEVTNHNLIEGEENPVDLDVSFKSNALVAKAIVTPLRSPVVSDARESRNDVQVEKESAQKSDIGGSDVINSSTTENDEIHIEIKRRDRRKPVLHRADNSYSKAQASSSMADMHHGEHAPSGSPTAKIFVKTDPDARFAKTPSPNPRKKRKVMIPHSQLSSVQMSSKVGESDNIGTLVSTSAAEPDKSLKDLGYDIPSGGNLTKQLVSSLVDGVENSISCPDIVEKDPAVSVSDKRSTLGNEIKSSGLKSLADSSKQEDIMKSPVNSCVSAYDAETTLASGGADSLKTSLCTTAVSVDEIHQKDSAGAVVSLRGTVDSIISASDGTAFHFDQKNTSTEDIAPVVQDEGTISTGAIGFKVTAVKETEKTNIPEKPLSTSEGSRDSGLPSDVATSSSNTGLSLTDEDLANTAKFSVSQEQNCLQLLSDNVTTGESSIPVAEECFSSKHWKRNLRDECEELGSPIADTDGEALLAESMAISVPAQPSDINENRGFASMVGFSETLHLSIDEVSPFQEGVETVCRDSAHSMAAATSDKKQISLSSGLGSTPSVDCELPLPVAALELNMKMSPDSAGVLTLSTAEAGPALESSATVTVNCAAVGTHRHFDLAGGSGNDDGVTSVSVQADSCLVDGEVPVRGCFSSGSSSHYKDAAAIFLANLGNEFSEAERKRRIAKDNEISSAKFGVLGKLTDSQNSQTAKADPGQLVAETNFHKFGAKEDGFFGRSDSLLSCNESAPVNATSMLPPLVKDILAISSPETRITLNSSLEQVSSATPVPPGTSVSKKNQLNRNSDVTGDHQSCIKKAGSSALCIENVAKVVQSTASVKPWLDKRKPQSTPAPTKPVTVVKRPTTSQSMKPRTWRLTENPTTSTLLMKKPFGSTPPPKPVLNPTLKGVSNSYIRKGNSLVRNPTSAFPPASRASVQQLNPSGIAEKQNDRFEISKTPILPSSSDSSSCNEVPSGSVRSSPSADPLTGSEKAVSKVGNDTMPLRSPEIGLEKSLENQSPPNESLPSSTAKKMLYVKRKSNQLVASSNSSEHCLHNRDSAVSDSYFKRSKHQLVRASSESNVLQQAAVLDHCSDSEGKQTVNIQPDGSRRQKSVCTRTGRAKKFSLVWKLRKSEPAKKSVNTLWCQKVVPHLLPWKRATYFRSMWRSSANLPNNSPFFMSQKLLSSRKRGVVYSSSGFSIRRSKVVSLAGSSLKWSKSMERRCKKTNKGGDLADIGGNKRPTHTSSGFDSGAASHKSVDGTKLVPGERIYRIGSLRYKMDPSRRTLLRVPDKESSGAGSGQPGTSTSRRCVPRRLCIGNNEYVRIGNGNQLVRDPKRRTRLLASEKVRWSLHTARTRLARKRKYCLFFTKFGKCHKDEGKCPFIHDHSKIAVCTKFLKGLCSDPNCRLTHQIIPERMPDCSFFLQGMCSNESCPYRHVNVNPKADICDGFLKGYCADGNECRKKHSSTCPIYDATGSCPEGSKCKLYHPQNGRGKKRKNSRDHVSRKRRYFGLQSTAASEIAISGKPLSKRSEGMFPEGSPAQYISLDISDDEARESEDLGVISEHAVSSVSEALNSQLGNLDALIKPVRILN